MINTGCNAESVRNGSTLVDIEREEYHSQSENKRRGQVPSEQCHQCFQRGYRCGGKSPCGMCVRYKSPFCCSQGSK